MIYLLLVLLVALILIEYILSRRDLLYISLMSTLSFTFALVIVIVNFNWEYEMSIEAFFIFLGAFIIIFIGEHLTRSFFKTPKKRYGVKSYNQVNINKIVYIGTVIFMAISAFVYVYGIIRIGIMTLSSGVVGDDRSILGAYRYAAIREGNSGTKIAEFLCVISECLAYSYMLLFISNRKRKKYLIPIGLYLISIVFSTGRSSIIKFAIVTLVLYYLLETRPKGQTIKFEKTMFKIVLIGSVVFISLGTLTGKSNLYANFFENISMYTGSAIPAFDDYLSEYKIVTNSFGSETLWGINNFFLKFGINLFGTTNNYLPYIYLPYMNHSTNIYTFLRRPYNDFGLIGLFIVLLVISIVYTKIYLKIINNSYKNYTFSILMFATLYYPIFLSFTDFRFFDVISITGGIQIILYYYVGKYIDNQIKKVEYIQSIKTKNRRDYEIFI